MVTRREALRTQSHNDGQGLIVRYQGAQPWHTVFEIDECVVIGRFSRWRIATVVATIRNARCSLGMISVGRRGGRLAAHSLSNNFAEEPQLPTWLRVSTGNLRCAQRLVELNESRWAFLRLPSVSNSLLCLSSRTSAVVVAGLFVMIVPLEAVAQASASEQPSTGISANGDETLQEVVVTGVAASGGVKKINASFSVTTATLDEVRDLNPSSSADLLKMVPGIWPESSGGETGANIDIAGFPGGGDAPFVTYQIDGSPVYPVGSLSFMDNSSQFRLDDTVERVEVVQGGPSVVTSTGQIGATANFILRQGTDTPHGEIEATVGTEGLYRLDGYYGGPLVQGWYASVGGFYRYSDGIRASQYPADNGGQFTATLSRPMEHSSLLFFLRELDDKNLFITDIPVSVAGTGSATSVAGFPGFNPNTGTFAGNGLRYISVQESPAGAPVTADLADGRGSSIHTFGSDWEWHTDSGVSVANKLMYSAGSIDCYCLFNNSAPQTLASFIGQEIAAANANSSITSAYPMASAGAATFANGGGAVSPNSYVASLAFWIVQKQVHSLTDELRLSLHPSEGNDLTIGGYVATYSASDHWWLGNNELVTATPNAELIDLKLNNGVNVTNAAGLLSASDYTLVQNWSGFNSAAFVSDQWKAGSWLIDGGYRIETQRDKGSIENTSSVDLDDNVLNLYNKDVNVPNGTFDQDVSCDKSVAFQPCTRYAHTFGSGSIGVNYELTSQTSLFGRMSKGVHFPSFDDLRSGVPNKIGVRSDELGFRGQTNDLSAFVEVFHRQFTGVAFQQFIALPPGSPAGALPYIDGSFGAKSYGVEWQAKWRPDSRWTLSLTGDRIHAVYTNYNNGSGVDYTGNVLDRQPSFQIRFTPEYSLPTSWGSMRVFVTGSYAGLNYSDVANLQVLPAFYTLDGGAVAGVGQNLEIRLQGSNLTNQIGLTEGNARTPPGISGISTNFEMARPIFGREVSLQLQYHF